MFFVFRACELKKKKETLMSVASKSKSKKGRRLTCGTSRDEATVLRR